MPDESEQLLQQYARERSEAAFRKLVRLHSGVVFGTALRKLGGDRAAAEDVMQEVFTLLVRKAATLEGVVLAGWLYRQTCRQAANHVRSESRRRRRELVAVAAMDSYAGDEPESGGLPATGMGEEIDRAMLALAGTDRDALVLRFFNDHDYKRVGACQGITEEAARKRVARALEKLAAILRRNGIATGSAISLGGTMSGMGAVSVPSTLIDRVAANALRAAPAGGLAALHPLLKSFLAGLLVTSAAAGTLAASRAHREAASTTASAPSTPVIVKREPLEPVYLKPVPENLTAEQLIAEIRKLNAGPANALMTMRMRLLVQALPLDQGSRFFELAKDALSFVEKRACYTPLLERWMKEDPDAAMTCAFHHGLQGQMGGSDGLIENIYARWMEKDAGAASKWLVKEWLNPALQARDFETTPGIFMAADTVDFLLVRGRRDDALEFAAAIPEADALEMLDDVLGGSPAYNAERQLTTEGAFRLYRALRAMSDIRRGSQAAHAFLRRRMKAHPDEDEKIRPLMSPAESFDRELIAFEQEGTGEAVINEMVQRGLAAGLPEKDVVQQVGEAVVLYGTDQSAALKFIDANQDRLSLDKVLERMASNQPGAWTSETNDGIPLHGLAPLLWASRISDPEKRLRLSRGTFRRMMCESAEARVRKVPDHPDLPADLARNFRTLLEETAR